MDEIKRLTPAQRARCNRLIRRLCANYDGGNCLPLDDGEGCVCVQRIGNRLHTHAAFAIVQLSAVGRWRRLRVCADDFLFAAVQVLPAGGSARRQGTLRRYLPAAYTDLRTVWKVLCSRQQPAEVLPGMRPHHPAQAEGRLCQTAAQRRTLGTGKALISGDFCG